MYNVVYSTLHYYFIECWQCLTVRNLSIKLYRNYVYQSQSHVTTDDQSASPSLVSFCLTFTVLSMSGDPSDDRSGLSSVFVTLTPSVQ
jgi:hypothetical protein